MYRIWAWLSREIGMAIKQIALSNDNLGCCKFDATSGRNDLRFYFRHSYGLVFPSMKE